MHNFRKAAALILALALLSAAALAEGWHAAEDNIPRFRKLFDLLGAVCDDPPVLDTAAAEEVLEEIRQTSADDGDVARAIADHWYGTTADPDYRMFVHRGGERAEELEESFPDFGGRHAFVVLGYQLRNGEMQEELVGRCDAAAAAARSFPDSILVCTGGVTGSGNPDNHSEAGEMKKYLTRTCGIAEDRIFAEARSRTTMENAVNTFRILKEQGIETITIVTSDYHQLWGQILFNAVAAVYAKSAGHTVRIAGNYNYPAQPGTPRTSGCRSGLGQLMSLISRGIRVSR